MAKAIFYVPFIFMVISFYALFSLYFVKKIEEATFENKISVKQRLGLLVIFLIPLIVLITFRKIESVFSPMIVTLCYVWITYLFLFFMLHGTFELLHLLVKKSLRKEIPAKIHIIIFQFICTLILIIGFFEAKNIVIDRIVLSSDKIKMGETYRIVQISDVHFSAINKESFAQKIVSIVNKEDPDIIVSTGDLIDRGMSFPDKICQELKNLKAKLGKYAVTGNHDYYFGIEEAVQFHKNCEFELLRNRSVQINEIALIGIDDKTAKRFDGIDLPSEKDLMSGSWGYKIYLKHQPEISKDVIPYFDLMLSGHTHAGQIFPFGFLVDLKYEFFKGLYKINSSNIYVSRGTGTWGPPIRFLAPPEITVIDIKGSGSL